MKNWPFQLRANFNMNFNTLDMFEKIYNDLTGMSLTQTVLTIIVIILMLLTLIVLSISEAISKRRND